MCEAVKHPPEDRAETDAYVAQLDAVIDTCADEVGVPRPAVDSVERAFARIVADFLIHASRNVSPGFLRRGRVDLRAIADGELLRGRR